MDYEMFREILSSPIVHMEKDPKYTTKATQGFFEGKKVEYSAVAESNTSIWPWLNIYFTCWRQN